MIVGIKKYGADWCGPCKALDKTLDKFEKLHPEIKVERFNVDEMISYKLDELNIKTIPVMFFVDESGKTVKRLGGAKSIQEIENELS